MSSKFVMNAFVLGMLGVRDKRWDAVNRTMPVSNYAGCSSPAAAMRFGTNAGSL